MKILLDECVTRKLKQHLSEFEVKTVVEMGWSGLKNGRLINAAVEEKFDVLLTIDKNIVHQQNLSNHEIAIVALDVEKAKLTFYLSFCRNSKRKLTNLKKEKRILSKKVF